MLTRTVHRGCEFTSLFYRPFSFPVTCFPKLHLFFTPFPSIFSLFGCHGMLSPFSLLPPSATSIFLSLFSLYLSLSIYLFSSHSKYAESRRLCSLFLVDSNVAFKRKKSAHAESADSVPGYTSLIFGYLLKENDCFVFAVTFSCASSRTSCGIRVHCVHLRSSPTFLSVGKRT